MPWDDKESEGIANWATLMSDLAESTVPKTQNHTNFDLRPHLRCRGVVVQQRAIRGPNFSPTLPIAQVGPSWSQLARVRRKLGPSWAEVQVGSCSAKLEPRMTKFDLSRLWFGQVGPLSSSLSYFLGASGTRREATRIYRNTMFINV